MASITYRITRPAAAPPAPAPMAPPPAPEKTPPPAAPAQPAARRKKKT
jgi:hypothetical protein